MPYTRRSSSHAIRDRLLRKLFVPLHKACAAKGLAPGVKRMERHLDLAIEKFVDDYAHVDLEAGDDAEDALLGNYYEENWNGEVEGACLEAILAEMGKDSVKHDPDSSPDEVLAAAGDEWGWDSYDYDPDE